MFHEMKPVYQTISNSINGNCLAATIASLLEKTIEDVPNFVDSAEWFTVMQEFMFKSGYIYDGYLINGNRTDLSADEKLKNEWFQEQLPEYGSINGFYDAVVFSKNFPGQYHAIVCDRNFNIVHDPSPIEDHNGYPKAGEIGYNGIIGVCLWKKV